MTLKLIYEPTVQLIARPAFSMPAALDGQYMMRTGLGAAKPGHGEWLAEFAGRACYLSWANPGRKTNAEYLANILAQGHGSVLEHANYSLYIEGVSRSLTHELVRHRAGLAYSQLSQRYVNASDVAFVLPPALLGDALPTMRGIFIASCQRALEDYQALLICLDAQYANDPDTTGRKKRAREAARSVLPNATETKLVVTGNIRAWRHVLAMRGSLGADVEIRRWALAVFAVLAAECPGFFQDATMANGGELVFAHHKV